jgi:hypothetical protein
MPTCYASFGVPNAMSRLHVRHLLSLGLGLAALLSSACLSFVGPEDPEPLQPPQVVDVTVEYEQLGDCPSGSDCQGPVVFYATWMRTGGEFSLERVASSRVWRGTAIGVPVNFPPQGEPYRVHVFDPLLHDTSCQGITAMRLVIGGEILRSHFGEGTPKAHALVYIDPTARGRNDF